MGGIFRHRNLPGQNPVWTTGTTLSLVHGQSVNLNTLCTDAQNQPITYTVSGGLPSGVTLTSPSVSASLTATTGTTSVTFIATTATGSATKTFQLTVSAVPIDLNALTVNVQIAPGTSVNLDQYRNGGIAPFAYVQSAGQAFALGGLTLDSNGTLNAAITAIQQTTSGYRVTVTDAQNISAQSPAGGFSVTVTTQASWNEATLAAALNFLQGTPNEILLSEHVIGWDPTKYVIQLSNAADNAPASASDLLPTGIGLDLDGRLIYDGIGAIASSNNIGFKINPIQQDFTQRVATRGVIRTFAFDNVADLGTLTFGSPTYITFANPAIQNMANTVSLDTAVKASGTSSMRFLSDLNNANQTVYTSTIGTGNGSTSTFTANYMSSPGGPGTGVGTAISRTGGVGITITAGSVTAQDATFTPTNGLNRAGTITGSGVTGTLDYATGAISVTFPTPPANGTPITVQFRLGSGTTATWGTNFSNDQSIRPAEGEEYCISWRMRFDQNRIYCGGLKLVIDSWSDEPGCTPSNAAQTAPNGYTYGKGSGSATEIVIQQVAGWPFPGMYTTQPGTGYYDQNGNFVSDSQNFTVTISGSTSQQNARPAPFCLNSQGTQNPPFSNTACFLFYPNEWMSFKTVIKLGRAVPKVPAPPINNNIAPGCYSNSRVRMWMARDPAVVGLGAASQFQPVIDVIHDIGMFPHGKFYFTTRATEPAFFPNNQWQDELIISRTQIASPS